MGVWHEESYRELLLAELAVAKALAPAEAVARVLVRRREGSSETSFLRDLASEVGVAVETFETLDAEADAAGPTKLRDEGLSLPLQEALARTLPGASRDLAREGVPTRAPLRRMPEHRYIDLEPVGKGGMGLVYLALDTELNREVALKLIRPRDGTDGLKEGPATAHTRDEMNALAPRFLQEAWVMGGLEHPSILPVHEIGETPAGVPYYSMPFVKGARTFRQALAELAGEPFERRLALLEPFLKVCDALAFAHARDVCHRDVKPENIALGEYGEVFLLDWGLARVRPDREGVDTPWHERLREFRSEAALETATQALGTPGYMAPEALMGQADRLDARSDVYSLGVMLHEVLTGGRPFSGESPSAYVSKTMHVDPEPPSRRESAVPHALDRLCASALARDPDARPADAGVVAKAVRDWQARSEVDREIESHLERAQVSLEGAQAAEGEERLRQAARAVACVDQALALDAGNERAATYREAASRLRRQGLDEHARSGRRRMLLRVGVLGLVLAAIGAAIVAGMLDQRRRQAEAAERAQAHERGRATRAFNEVRSLARTFIFDFHDRIADLPGSLDARKLIVEKALVYLDRLAEDAPDSPELQHELASGYLRIGMLQGDPGSSNLGDLDGSVTSLEKAIAVASRPQEGDRDDVKVAVTIARAHQSAARILVARYVRGGRAEDDAKRSIDHSEQALDILEDLVEGDPANTFLREKLADALLADATVNTFLERNELSIEALRRAEKIWRELAAEGVATVDCLDLSLSRCLYDQGRVFGNPYSTYDGKDPAKARECLEESMGLAQKCVKESPDSTAAVNAVLLSTTALAPLAEDPERGLALYGQALELTGRLRELDPTDARSLNGRGLVLRNMGKLQVRMGEPEAAAVTFGRAIETFEELAALRGAAREAAPLAMLHERQARILIELDQLEDVVSHFDEALRHWAVYCKPSAGEQCANLHVPHAYERAASSLKAIGRDQDVARLGRDAEAVYECIDVERVGLFSFHESRATLRVLHADALAQLDEPAQARRLYGLALADVEAALPVAPDAKGRETLAARAEVLREKASSTDD